MAQKIELRDMATDAGMSMSEYLRSSARGDALQRLHDQWSKATGGSIQVTSGDLDGSYSTEWQLELLSDTLLPSGVERVVVGKSLAEVVRVASAMLVALE